MRCAHSSVLLRVLLAGVGVGISAMASARAQPTGRIRGVVYDSLTSRPVSGATVSAIEARRTTFTDARGRFELDSMPVGTATVSFASPTLDSLGLFTLARAVNVASTKTVDVTLATPSLATLWRALCPRTVAVPGDSGIVYGEVVDAATETRYRGARISASWWSMESTGNAVNVARLSSFATTDSTGSYRLCGTPTGTEMTVQADAGRAISGELNLQLGVARIRRRDFLVSDEMNPSRADSARSADSRRSAILRGVVRDSKGNAVPDALITLPSASITQRSNAEGRFVLSAVPAGTQPLHVLRVGFAPMITDVDLRADQTTDVVLSQSEMTTLATVNVVADRRVNLARQAFDDRRRKGFGYFLSGRELTESFDLTFALQRVPSVQVRGSGSSLSIGMGSGFDACTPELFIDGRRVTLEEFRFYQPRELAGLEIYTSPGTVPPQFMLASSMVLGRRCGVIAAWTKYAR